VAAKLTPMMRQYQEIKQKYPDSILFFRMGDFYEMFGQDAITAAPVMEIVLTSRDRQSEDKIPMCGVPHHSVETYIAKLIAKNFKVAICEQIEDPKTAKGLVKRDVVRIISPGTLLESNLLTARDNNYIASLAQSRNRGGLALLDLSTGEFLATEVEGDDVAKRLLDEMSQWSPREILHAESWDDLGFVTMSGSITVKTGFTARIMPAIRLHGSSTYRIWKESGWRGCRQPSSLQEHCCIS